MPPIQARTRTGTVAAAIAAIKSAIVGIEISSAPSSRRVRRRGIADTVGPCIVSGDVHTAHRTALNRNDQAVVAQCARIFSRCHVSIKLSFDRVLQEQPSPLICVCSCRACGSGSPEHISLRGAHSVNRSSGEVDSAIDVAPHPQVDRMISQIAAG